ncbi:hypothetical protein FHS83_002790 [Rhizomicrobium palustre]|uniref:Uncharacterized protein n=1 Tax=Rhizomicrobium palustre TaxID=189966 RepID=A0A846N2M1_9PROT|nr:hypothetical protein [Rhizomicrobium palustre]NIK89472.1 hypothetical protein [Rhizomicrobium palustre]
MQIASSTAIPAATSAAVSAPPQETSPASSSAPTDQLTLSPAAQAALTSPTKPAETWSSDAVTKGLAALNDMSGKTSLDDQLSAYKSLAALVADASNFDPTKAGNDKAVDVATAFATSAYVEHYRAMASQDAAFNGQISSDNWGKGQADIEQRRLDYFNSLSENDQRLLIQTRQATWAASGFTGGGSASPEDAKALLSAQADVSRAVEAVLADPTYAAEIAAKQDAIKDSEEDRQTATTKVIQQKAQALGDAKTLALMELSRGGKDFVARAKAYFDQYGPAPQQSDAEKAADATAPLPASGYRPLSVAATQDFFKAVSTLADTSGKATAIELGEAFNKTTDVMIDCIKHGYGDVAALASGSTALHTTGAKQINQAEKQFESAWMPGGGPEVERAQAWFRSYEHLDDFDQQLLATTQQGHMGDGTPDSFRATLVDWVANAAQCDAISALNQAKNYGHLTAKSTVTILGVTLNLNSIMASDDMRLDPYTRMSADVKALLKDAAEKWAAGEKVSIDATKLYKAPPTDAEKALATLKAYQSGNHPKTDDEKALAALKDAQDGKEDKDAGLTLLEKAAEAKKAAEDKKDKDAAKTDDADNKDKKPAAATALPIAANQLAGAA